jgi:hypothetical protein
MSDQPTTATVGNTATVCPECGQPATGPGGALSDGTGMWGCPAPTHAPDEPCTCTLLPVFTRGGLCVKCGGNPLHHDSPVAIARRAALPP